MNSTHHKTVTATIRGVEVVCTGVVFYPYEPATIMDPAEPPSVEWDKITIGGQEVQELFHGSHGSALEDVLINQLEQ